MIIYFGEDFSLTPASYIKWQGMPGGIAIWEVSAANTFDGYNPVRLNDVAYETRNMREGATVPPLCVQRPRNAHGPNAPLDAGIVPPPPPVPPPPDTVVIKPSHIRPFDPVASELCVVATNVTAPPAKVGSSKYTPNVPYEPGFTLPEL